MQQNLNTFARLRLQNKHAIVKIVQKLGECEEDEIIKPLTEATGLTYKKIRQYIAELVHEEKLTEKNGYYKIPAPEQGAVK